MEIARSNRPDLVRAKGGPRNPVLTYRSPRSREFLSVRSACGPASRGSGFGSDARAGGGGAERSCGRLTGGGGGAERSCGRLTGDGGGASRTGAEGGAAAGAGGRYRSWY